MVRKKGSKEEYEKLLNEIFGVNVKWSKLSLEELIQIATVLANPDSLIIRLGGIPKSSMEAEVVNRVRGFLRSFSYEGPLIKILKRAFGVEDEEEVRKNA